MLWKYVRASQKVLALWRKEQGNVSTAFAYRGLKMSPIQDHDLVTFRTPNEWWWITVCQRCGKSTSSIHSSGQAEIRFTTVHSWNCTLRSPNAELEKEKDRQDDNR